MCDGNHTQLIIVSMCFGSALTIIGNLVVAAIRTRYLQRRLDHFMGTKIDNGGEDPPKEGSDDDAA